ncbi:endonuclease/exonuclease/phosphatase, partial [Phlyctema vagabunda]
PGDVALYPGALEPGPAKLLSSWDKLETLLVVIPDECRHPGPVSTTLVVVFEPLIALAGYRHLARAWPSCGLSAQYSFVTCESAVKRLLAGCSVYIYISSLPLPNFPVCTVIYALLSVRGVKMSTATPIESRVPFTNSSSPATTLRFLSYNVRYDSKPDNISVRKTIQSLPQGLPVQPSPYYADVTEKPWSTRRIGIVNDILWPRVDVYGAQELLKRQVDDVQELLGAEWDHVGVGRDNGKEAGEYSAIFYRKAAVTLLSWDTFWLSNTPFQPSKYPGAGSYRICTTAHFQLAGSSRVFTFMNSHLDDRSDAQRRLASSLMLHRAGYESSLGNRSVIMSGDFNSPTSGADGGAYQIITGAIPGVPINETFRSKFPWSGGGGYGSGNGTSGFVMVDVKATTPPQRRSGDFATFSGFRRVGDAAALSRIDYIFGGSNGGW